MEFIRTDVIINPQIVAAVYHKLCNRIAKTLTLLLFALFIGSMLISNKHLLVLTCLRRLTGYELIPVIFYMKKSTFYKGLRSDWSYWRTPDITFMQPTANPKEPSIFK